MLFITSVSHEFGSGSGSADVSFSRNGTRIPIGRKEAIALGWIAVSSWKIYESDGFVGDNYRDIYALVEGVTCHWRTWYYPGGTKKGVELLPVLRNKGLVDCEEYHGLIQAQVHPRKVANWFASQEREEAATQYWLKLAIEREEKEEREARIKKEAEEHERLQQERRAAILKNTEQRHPELVQAGVRLLPSIWADTIPEQVLGVVEDYPAFCRNVPALVKKHYQFQKHYGDSILFTRLK